MNTIDWIQTLPTLPPRPEDGHKGTFGTVLVLGGSPLMVGAPALCATAALRSGAGLVKVIGDLSWLSQVLAIQPSATGLDRADLQELQPKDGSVWAVGPGLGTDAQAAREVAIALRSDRPVVLDADGLNLVAQNNADELDQVLEARLAPTVLTPHPGEFRRLAEVFDIEGDPTDPESRPEAAAALARATGAVVLLKGQHTIVTDGQRAYRNPTGSPALATAGSGDVLTGLIAGLLAQGAQPLEAAIAGAYVHGHAGQQWADQYGPRGLLAMELADRLPLSFKAYPQGPGLK